MAKKFINANSLATCFLTPTGGFDAIKSGKIKTVTLKDSLTIADTNSIIFIHDETYGRYIYAKGYIYAANAADETLDITNKFFSRVEIGDSNYLTAYRGIGYNSSDNDDTNDGKLVIEGVNKWIDLRLSVSPNKITIGHDSSKGFGKTVGSSESTSGNSIDIPYIKYDDAGHITAAGTHAHTIPSVTPGDGKFQFSYLNQGDANEIVRDTSFTADSSNDAIVIKFIAGNNIKLDHQGDNGLLITGVNTDTHVTDKQYHYTPNTDSSLVANASGATAAWGIDVVKGIKIEKDDKGHITGLSVTSGKLPNQPDIPEGTITSITPEDGLVNGSGTNTAITTSGTIKVSLKDYVKNSVDSTKSAATTGGLYSVELDKSSKLAVRVPWTDTKTTKDGHYTPTADTYTPDEVTFSWDSTTIVTDVSKDSKGHITGIKTTKIANPAVNAVTTNDTLTKDKIVLGNGDKTVQKSTFGINTTFNSNSPSDTQLVTELAISNFVNSKLTSVLKYKGTVGTGGDITTLPTTHSVGDVYIVKTAGTYAGQVCEPGDYILCSSTANSNASWSVVTGENQVVNNNAELTSNSTVTIATIDGTDITVKVPELTKLTAGYGDTTNPYGSKTKNYVLAAPATTNGVPSFRALVKADIPDLDYSPIDSADSDWGEIG